MVKNYRTRNKGWKGESQRHALASRGVKTKTQSNMRLHTQVTSSELHETEMKLANLLDEKELTRDDIINEFTPLINKARQNQTQLKELTESQVSTLKQAVELLVQAEQDAVDRTVLLTKLSSKQLEDLTKEEEKTLRKAVEVLVDLEQDTIDRSDLINKLN